MSKGELLCLAAAKDPEYWATACDFQKKLWEQQAERYEQLKAEKFPDAHADAMAEAGRLREALESIGKMHRLNDPDPKETALRMCAEAEEALSATPTTAAWLEARDRRMKLIGAAEELDLLAKCASDMILRRAAKLRREAGE